MNKKVLIVGAILTLPLLLVLAIAFRYDPHSFDSPLIGKPAPGFTLVDLDGKQVSLSQFKGKPVLVNFWATWCGPCKQEHPLLVQASQFYGDRVGMLSVVYQDEPENIAAYLKQWGSWGENLVDVNGQAAIAYGVYGVPETYFIDSEGIITYKHVGPLDGGTLREKLDGML